MAKKSYLFLFFVFLLVFNLRGQDLTILPVGHSHNDYTRDRPLFDALKYGFTSIEVDVYLHEGRMVVTHDDKNLDAKKDIQELYLDPLKSIIDKNGGTVYKDNQSKVVLMVDLKSEKVTTYQALVKIFKKYTKMIEWYQNGQKKTGPIQVLLTGGPPIDIIEKESNRYFLY